VKGEHKKPRNFVLKLDGLLARPESVDLEALARDITNPAALDPANQKIVEAVTRLVWTQKRPDIKYAGPAHFVLAHGRRFGWAPLPQKLKRGDSKECFKNALNATKKDLVYVEGFVLLPGFPALVHAWNTDDSGHAIDRTYAPEVAQASEYFGVAFETEYVVQTKKARRGEYGVLENHQEMFPLCLNDELLPKALDPRFR
jgi:hypothetical protein